MRRLSFLCFLSLAACGGPKDGSNEDNSEISSVSSAVDDLSATVDAQGSELLGLAEEVGGVGADVAALQSSLTEVDDVLNGLEADIAAVETDSTALETELAAQHAETSSRLDALESVVSFTVRFDGTAPDGGDDTWISSSQPVTHNGPGDYSVNFEPGSFSAVACTVSPLVSEGAGGPRLATMKSNRGSADHVELFIWNTSGAKEDHPFAVSCSAVLNTP